MTATDTPIFASRSTSDSRNYGKLITVMAGRQNLKPGHPYPARNSVERFFNKIRQSQRIATRYDKLAVNDLAYIEHASVRILLRAFESAP